MQKSFKEKVIQFARDKAIREQRNIVLIKKSDGSYYSVQPEELYTEGEIEQIFKTQNFSDSEIETVFESIEDHSNLESGDNVLVVDEENKRHADQVVRTSSRQIVCKSGSKFKKSDGTQWGGGPLVIDKKKRPRNNE